MLREPLPQVRIWAALLEPAARPGGHGDEFVPSRSLCSGQEGFVFQNLLILFPEEQELLRMLLEGQVTQTVC